VIYEKPDRNAYYVRLADDAIMIGEDPGRIIWMSTRSSGRPKKAVQMPYHPGYGFLAENADFSAGCEKEALSLLDRSQVIHDLGNKVGRPIDHAEGRYSFHSGTGDLFAGSTVSMRPLLLRRKTGIPGYAESFIGRRRGRGIESSQ